MKKNYKIGVIISVVAILLLLILWGVWRFLGAIHKIEIIGNDYIPQKEILSLFSDTELRLSGKDSRKIIEKLKQNPFIKSVSLETKWTTSLLIRLQVENIVGKIENKDKTPTYLSSDGKLLSQTTFAIEPSVPDIVLFKEISKEQVIFLAKQLAIFAYSYEDFFKKFQRINLASVKNVSIIISSATLGSARKYEMYHSPSVHDLIEIALIDGKYSQGSTIILGQDSVIVKD